MPSPPEKVYGGRGGGQGNAIMQKAGLVPHCGLFRSESGMSRDHLLTGRAAEMPKSTLLTRTVIGPNGHCDATHCCFGFHPGCCP